jgi:hypothetical protein
MSFSFRLPEEDPVCECKYDETHDRTDREDCPFHCHMVDAEPAELEADRKPPASIGVSGQRLASALEDRRRRRGGYPPKTALI